MCDIWGLFHHALYSTHKRKNIKGAVPPSHRPNAIVLLSNVTLYDFCYCQYAAQCSLYVAVNICI